MKKPLLVGEAPSRTTEQFLVPFDPRSRSGQRMEKLLGQPVLRVFDVRNLLGEWPGPSSKGSAWDAEKAREAAIEVMQEWERGQLLVLLGRRVARAFAVSRLPYLEVFGERFPLVVFPHPSGVDRWWNEAANLADARDFLRAVARESA